MELINICKIYHNKNNDVQALKDINIFVPNKGMTFILGPSGCGKTTLLNIICGQDRDYSGEIKIEGKIESITQEIQLFENLSIMDNLLMVCDDCEKINDLLLRFKLNFPKRKVKKLSVGEKKRVQIIRSLLGKADYLVCDEPTAALDYDNSQLIMELLKELSKDIAVVIVTHRIAVVDQYADYVIQMGKGCIVDVKQINEITNSRKKERISQKKSKKEHLLFIYKLIKSRWYEELFEMGILFGIILVMFVAMYIFPSLTSKSQAMINWQNGKNVIITRPTEEVYYTPCCNDYHFGRYVTYDLYQKEDIEKVVNNIDGVLGYRYGWDQENYSIAFGTSFFPMITIEEHKAVYEKYLDEYLQTGVDPIIFFYDYEWEIQMREEYPEWEHLHTYEHDTSNTYGLKIVPTSAVVPSLWSVYIDNALHSIDAYDLLDGVTIEVAYGNMAENENEIVITKNYAEELCSRYKLSNIEELINREVEIWLVYDDVYNVDYFDPNRDLSKDSRVGYRSYSYVISGISFIEPKYEKQVYFVDGAYEKMLVDIFGFKPEVSTYQYVQFLIDPLKDGQQVAKEINTLLESKDSQFTVLNSIMVDGKEEYQNPSVLAVFVLFALITLFSLYIIKQILFNKRTTKENQILIRYYYDAWLIDVGKLLMIMMVVMITQLIGLSSVCEWINQIANRLDIIDIVSNDIYAYLKVFVLTTMMIIAVKGGIYAIRIKKRQ